MRNGLVARLRRTSVPSEEERAAGSVVLAVTASAGTMLVLLGAVDGVVEPILLPTVALLAGIARRDAVTSAWAAMAAWIVVVPQAAGTAVVAPLLMIAICLALAVGPERLADGVHGWFAAHGGRPAPDPSPEPRGWIEETPPAP